MKYDPYSKTNQYIIDGLITAFSFYLAYQIRFEGEIPPNYVFQLWALFPVVVAGRLGTSTLFKVYRIMWRYFTLKDAVRVSVAYLAFSALPLVLRLSLVGWTLFRIPLSVIAIEFSLSLFGALSIRGIRKIAYRREQSSSDLGGEQRRVLLVGAGSAGLMTATELSFHPHRKLVGFLDDDPRKIGAMVGGIPVLGPIDQMTSVVKEYGVQDIVLCITKAPRELLKRVWRLCEGLEVRTLIIPTLSEIFEGHVQISRLREVRMEDLLGRETIDMYSNRSEVAQFYRGRRILITGAGGSIGSELARQLAGFEPESLILLDKDENGLHELQLQLTSQRPVPAHEVLVGDVRSSVRVRRIFEKFQPEVVFHAAAHKHVPLMELNAAEAVMNNVFGTLNVVNEAVSCQNSLLVFISTDKAVRPASVMGASKRLAELIVQSRSAQANAGLLCVRFGNVMSSRGSVIPLFQKQIVAGGPLTLTDPDVCRYFMTMPEAVQLVIETSLLKSRSRATFVLDMGDPVRIVDLARDLIELQGLRPGQDIRIETVGLRPGEKMREELVGDGEQLEPTENPMILSVRATTKLEETAFGEMLEKLWCAARDDKEDEVLCLLRSTILSSRLRVPHQ